LCFLPEPGILISFNLFPSQINELNIAVNDLRGKFIKPTLKKVSKYENKFAKLQKKAAEFNFRNQLKTVKKKEFTMDEEEGAAAEVSQVLRDSSVRLPSPGRQAA